jgi:eukaryotic-like serine/threonine-protein kinase
VTSGQAADSAGAARWPQVEAALDAALALPPAQRGAHSCRRDPPLADEIAALLQAEQSLGSFLEPAAAVTAGAVATLEPGRRIGAFRIERLIGRGGMSEVYLAERADDQFSQRVALKLISAPLAARPERFYAERRILARLEHPGIARLVDGGVSEDGRPYMAVEYVEGTDLLRYCRDHAPDLERRLQLFTEVCAAVAYAHRHLVVHRDLKPGNVLVTADGQPKLLDFGIATLLDAPHGHDAQQTLHLTPSHAAPEQLEGGSITTATDVYALGVILYELLSGAPPWQFSKLPLALAVARVLDSEPPRPSARAAPALARQIRGDLDSIVLKAMRKSPEQRYASASELLEELQRYRRHEPVSAAGQGWRYVSSRFVRRNRLAVASAGAVLLALVGGLVTSLWFFDEARAERQRAQVAAATAQAVNDFLNRDLLAAADINRRPTRDIGLRELLDQAAQRADQRFAGQPEVAARVHESLADSYFNLNAYTPALTQYQKAHDLQARLQGPQSAVALAVLAKLANTTAYAARIPEALALFDAAIAGFEQLGDARQLAQIRMEKAGMLFGAGELLASTEEMRQILDTEAAAPALTLEERLELQARYGVQLGWLGEFAAAERETRAALTERERLLGPDQLPTAMSRIGLGMVLLDQHRLDAAAAAIEPALAATRRWVGPDDAFLATAENATARLRAEQGRLREAETLLANALRIRTLVFGEENGFTAWTMNQLAEVLQRQGRLREALALTERAVPVAERLDGTHNPWTTRQRLTRAAILRELGEDARAQALLDRIGPDSFRALPPRHPFLALLRQEQGLLAARRGDPAHARAALSEALSIFEQRYGADHPRSQRAREQLARVST